MKSLTAVMVGCGGIAEAWLKPAQAMPDLEIVGLVDLNLDAARNRAQKFSLDDTHLGTNLGEALDKLKPDVVFDLTTPESHLQVARCAFEHRCHLLGEKPLAASMAEAHQIVSAAKTAQRQHALLQNRRYDARIRRVRRAVEEEYVGQLTMVHCDFFIAPHFGGFREKMEHPLLLDMAIHHFDAARLLTGQDPVKVYCHEWNPVGSWYAGKAAVTAVYQFTNDLVFSYRGCWCADGLPTTWESSWRLVGDRGTILWDGADDFRCARVNKTGSFFSQTESLEWPIFDPGVKQNGHAGCIREFLDCLNTGSQPETNGEDNLRSLAMVFGAITSSDSGQAVSITDLYENVSMVE